MNPYMRPMGMYPPPMRPMGPPPILKNNFKIKHLKKNFKKKKKLFLN